MPIWSRAHGEHDAIKRTRVTKMAAQLLRLVLAYVLSGLSLRSTVTWADDVAGQASFSDVALLKRVWHSGPWLAELVGMLSTAVNQQGARAAIVANALWRSMPRPSARRASRAGATGSYIWSTTLAHRASAPC